MRRYGGKILKVSINFDTEANVTGGSNGGSLSSVALWCDYIYLDTDERRRFAQTSHEYLIEQLQFTGIESVTQNTLSEIDINFNHPIMFICVVDISL